MENIEISVVMAEYNTNPDDLKEAIQSILNQTFKEFEFIIVDDHGKNDLNKIVNDFNDSRIRIIDNKSNKGFVYSLNNGIKNAKGKYIVRMDTDDISDKRRIEILYNFIKSHPEYAVVGTKAIEFSGKEKSGILGKSGEKKKKNIMRGDIVIHASAIMKKEAIEKIGYYKEYKRAEDLVLWCELLINNYRLYMLDDELYYYRVNLSDYNKRKLKYRKDEIRARFKYYPLMNANLIDYMFIFKSIISGILPNKLIKSLRKKLILKK